ncbi:metallophosphoesterase family protein [Miltoncostaea marina]|uniref:metallophosphoesterase family protein n=1 Tax=Miltoncostaea marina TaxID=2843215 RepID=UPI001C3C6AA1|nr:metallophosphoesterase family protein [Miltoncostaea marina]
MARVALISDTHMPRRGRALPPACLERLRAADLIVHAGDWSDMAAVELVRAVGPPVVGVRGNVEDAAVRAALPETAEVELAPGVRLGVVHDAGPEAGRLARLRRRFPGAAAVVFGHSHIPLWEVAADGFAIVNPGSPTDRRRQPRCTMAELEAGPAAGGGGAAPRVRFLAVDAPAGPLADGLVRGRRPARG